jgi:hypothetical protein
LRSRQSLIHSRIPQNLYGTERFITGFSRTVYWALSSGRSIQSIPPHPLFLRSILILSTRLGLGHLSGLLPFGFTTKILYEFFSPMRATCPAYITLLDLIILIILGEKYKLLSSSLCSFLQLPITSFLFGPNILLHTYTDIECKAIS